MPRGVGVLRAKRGAEGVTVADRAGEDFRLQLPADRQRCRLAEEVEFKVHRLTR